MFRGSRWRRSNRGTQGSNFVTSAVKRICVPEEIVGFSGIFMCRCLRTTVTFRKGQGGTWRGV